MEMTEFTGMPYQRPDMESYAQAHRTAIAALRGAKTYEEARKAYFDLQQEGEKVYTMFSLAHVRNTLDTRDDYYDGEVAWLREQNANMIPLYKELEKVFVSSPFRPDFEKEFGKQLLKLTDASLKTADERIIQDTIRVGQLTQQYQKDSAMAQTEFRGESCNFYGLLKHMQKF